VVPRNRLEVSATHDPDEVRHALRTGCHLSCVRSLRTQQTGLPNKHPPFARSRRRALWVELVGNRVSLQLPLHRRVARPEPDRRLSAHLFSAVALARQFPRNATAL
jgi:hypothetical protein